MLLYRSASLPHFHKLSSPPKFLSHCKHSYSLLSNPSPPPSCPSFPLLKLRFFSLNPPRQRQARAFATATATAGSERKGTDTFFADEDVSWASLGVSHKLSRALYNAGIDRPSLVQVYTPCPCSLISWIIAGTPMHYFVCLFDEKSKAKREKYQILNPGFCLLGEKMKTLISTALMIEY